MKRTLVCISLICCPILLSAQTHGHQQGTIIRMRMTDCMGPQHAFITAMSGGGARTEPGALCPEYVLMGDTVVYVIIGKSSEQLLPLADVTRFRFRKNEMLIRGDDAAKESRFHIKAMALRPEWDPTQQIEESEAMAAAHHRRDEGVMMDAPQ